MNKVDAYTKTRRNPETLVEQVEKRFMVNLFFYHFHVPQFYQMMQWMCRITDEKTQGMMLVLCRECLSLKDF